MPGTSTYTDTTIEVLELAIEQLKTTLGEDSISELRRLLSEGRFEDIEALTAALLPPQKKDVNADR